MCHRQTAEVADILAAREVAVDVQAGQRLELRVLRRQRFHFDLEAIDVLLVPLALIGAIGVVERQL